MEVKITKILLSNEGNEFKVNNDICFKLLRNEKEYECFGIIHDIQNDMFLIRNVQIDKMNISDTLSIKFEEVKDGIIRRTDISYY